MTDAIKRLRDASYVDDCDGNCEGWDSVHLDDSERILTDAVAAERARIREALLERFDKEAHKRVGTAIALFDLTRITTEVCGGSHD